MSTLICAINQRHFVIGCLLNIQDGCSCLCTDSNKLPFGNVDKFIKTSNSSYVHENLLN